MIHGHRTPSRSNYNPITGLHQKLQSPKVGPSQKNSWNGPTFVTSDDPATSWNNCWYSYQSNISIKATCTHNFSLCTQLLHGNVAGSFLHWLSMAIWPRWSKKSSNFTFFKCWVGKLKFCVQVAMKLMFDWWEYQKLFQLIAGSSGVTKIGPFRRFCRWGLLWDSVISDLKL